MKIKPECHSTVVVYNHTLTFLLTAEDLVFGINILVILLIDLEVCPKSFHPSGMIQMQIPNATAF